MMPTNETERADIMRVLYPLEKANQYFISAQYPDPDNPHKQLRDLASGLGVLTAALIDFLQEEFDATGE